MIIVQAAVGYAIAYLLAAWVIGDGPGGFWLRAIGPLLPALIAVGVILVRREAWQGAQAVFWTAIAAGLTIWSIGHVGFVRESLAGGTLPNWLAWHTTFSLIGGGAAPMLALLARPHLGRRSSAVPAITLDITALSVLFLFIYAYFVLAPNLAQADGVAQRSLQLVIVVQRLLVLAAFALAAWSARGTGYGRVFLGPWGAMAAGFLLRPTVSAQVLRDKVPVEPLRLTVLDLAWTVAFVDWAWAA